MAAYLLAVVWDRLKTRARCRGSGPAVSALWSTRERSASQVSNARSGSGIKPFGGGLSGRCSLVGQISPRASLSRTASAREFTSSLR